MHVVKPPCVRLIRADIRVLRIPALAVGTVAVIPPELLEVVLRVAAVVVCARRPRAAGILPLCLGRQVEGEARARLELPDKRRRIDVRGTRPVVGGGIAADRVPRNVFHRPHVALVGGWIRSRHQLPLLLRHLKDATVERLRQRHLVRAPHHERARPDQPQHELRGLVFVGVEAARRNRSNVSDRIGRCVRAAGKVDHAIRLWRVDIRNSEHHLVRLDFQPLRIQVPHHVVRTFRRSRVAGERGGVCRVCRAVHAVRRRHEQARHVPRRQPRRHVARQGVRDVHLPVPRIPLPCRHVADFRRTKGFLYDAAIVADAGDDHYVVAYGNRIVHAFLKNVVEAGLQIVSVRVIHHAVAVVVRRRKRVAREVELLKERLEGIVHLQITQILVDDFDVVVRKLPVAVHIARRIWRDELLVLHGLVVKPHRRIVPAVRFVQDRTHDRLVRDRPRRDGHPRLVDVVFVVRGLQPVPDRRRADVREHERLRLPPIDAVQRIGDFGYHAIRKNAKGIRHRVREIGTPAVRVHIEHAIYHVIRPDDIVRQPLARNEVADQRPCIIQLQSIQTHSYQATYRIVPVPCTHDDVCPRHRCLLRGSCHCILDTFVLIIDRQICIPNMHLVPLSVI